MTNAAPNRALVIHFINEITKKLQHENSVLEESQLFLH